MLQWLKTPQLPEILPDSVSAEEDYGGESFGEAVTGMTMGDVLKSLD